MPTQGEREVSLPGEERLPLGPDNNQENAAGIFRYSAGRKGGRGAQRRGKPRPLPLGPFPLPREMIIRLYETDSKRVLLRELIFYFSFKTHISQTLPRTEEKIILNKK